MATTKVGKRIEITDKIEGDVALILRCGKGGHDPFTFLKREVAIKLIKTLMTKLSIDQSELI